jgi:hypothetical protein
MVCCSIPATAEVSTCSRVFRLDGRHSNDAVHVCGPNWLCSLLHMGKEAQDPGGLHCPCSGSTANTWLRVVGFVTRNFQNHGALLCVSGHRWVWLWH